MDQPTRRSLLKCLPAFGGLPAITVLSTSVSRGDASNSEITEEIWERVKGICRRKLGELN